MATTFTIPLVTLPVGTMQLGPAPVADAETGFTVTIDRAVAGGLNALTSASVLSGDMQQSNDGGTTWQELGPWATNGGLIPVKASGSNLALSSEKTTLLPGTSRQLRVTITVSGPSPIAVAGSIVTA